MEATAAGLTTGTLGAFTVVHGAAAEIALTGVDRQPHLRRHPRPDRDDPGRCREHRHLRQHDRRRLRQGSGAGTVTGTGNATAAAGVATKTITGALVGSVTMEATAAGLTTGTLGAFTVVHGAATQIALTGSTTNLTSGATRVLTATIQDAAGNTVTSDNTTVVTFAQAVRRRHRHRHRQRDRRRRRRDEDDHRRSSSAPSRWRRPPPASRPARSAPSPSSTARRADIALTGSTANLTSGATRVLTATIQDAAGNTVTSDNSTVDRLRQAVRRPAPSAARGNATASAGVATKTITGDLVGSVTMEATAPGSPPAPSPPSPSSTAPPPTSSLTGATTNLTSGATRVLTATIQDAAGNTVTADNTTVDRVRAGLRRRHRHRHRQRHRRRRRRDQDDHRRPRRLGDDGGDRRRAHHRHPRRLHRRPRRRRPDRSSPARPPTSPPARPAS